MKPLALLVPACLFAASAGAQAPKVEFQKVAPKGGTFTVEMPGKPKVSESTAANGVKTTSYLVPVPDGPAYMLTVMEFPETMVKGKDPADIVKTLGKALVRKDEKMIGDKEVKLGKVPGREYFVEGKDSYDRHRMYMVGNRIYRLILGAGSRDEATTKDADRFFNSFKFTE